MTDVADIRALMERAEGAAHRGDFRAAEESLRLAVELQERTLGASSPEVASTLNNLAIVYERLDRPADAEAAYRRSFAIAKAAFGHDHPLVETSATNLREFCDARGIPFHQPEPVKVPTRIESPSSGSRRPILLGLIGLVALVAVAVVVSRRGPSPVSRATPPPPVSAAPTPAASVAPPAPAPPQPVAPAPKPLAGPPPRQATAPVAVELLGAQLCHSLDLESNWRCDPLPDSIGGGPVFFVTRLKSAKDATVEHRWYRNDKLAQSVSLQVHATGSGYRTYSRTTTGADRAGTWRVELRDAAGTVLVQKTFVVGPS